MKNTGQETWTEQRERVIASASCKQCGAQIGEACIVRGKPALVAIHKPRLDKANRG